MTIQETIKLLKMEMLGDSEQMECAKQIAVGELEKQIPCKLAPKSSKKLNCLFVVNATVLWI